MHDEAIQFLRDANLAAESRSRTDAGDPVNVSAALTSDDGRWKVKAWARNLLGEEYYSFIASSVLGGQGVPAAPRTFGGAIEWNF
jgi:iron complex outermembrane receptor protein